MKWYLKVVRDNYANFNGRARRTEFWMFVLINLIIYGALFGLSVGLMSASMPGLAKVFSVITLIYALGVLIPNLAVAVRRLQDIGKSGWMILVCLIPIVGGIWLIVLLATDSQPGTNEYGPNPKEGEMAGA